MTRTRSSVGRCGPLRFARALHDPSARRPAGPRLPAPRQARLHPHRDAPAWEWLHHKALRPIVARARPGRRSPRRLGRVLPAARSVSYRPHAPSARRLAGPRLPAPRQARLRPHRDAPAWEGWHHKAPRPTVARARPGRRGPLNSGRALPMVRSISHHPLCPSRPATSRAAPACPPTGASATSPRRPGEGGVAPKSAPTNRCSRPPRQARPSSPGMTALTPQSPGQTGMALASPCPLATNPPRATRPDG